MKGENIPAAEVPESFKVLIKEMRSLCLNVEARGSRPCSAIDVSRGHGRDRRPVALTAPLPTMPQKTEDDDASALESIAAELGDFDERPWFRR